MREENGKIQDMFCQRFVQFVRCQIFIRHVVVKTPPEFCSIFVWSTSKLTRQKSPLLGHHCFVVCDCDWNGNYWIKIRYYKRLRRRNKYFVFLFLRFLF